MRMIVLTLLLFLEVSLTNTFAECSPWPILPAKGLIVGRVAVRKDIADGNAVFSSEDENGAPIGTAMGIEIPQYACWHDGKNDSEVPVVVVQAEFANGNEIVGVRDVNGNEIVCTKAELTVLGRKHP